MWGFHRQADLYGIRAYKIAAPDSRRQAAGPDLRRQAAGPDSRRQAAAPDSRRQAAGPDSRCRSLRSALIRYSQIYPRETSYIF